MSACRAGFALAVLLLGVPGTGLAEPLDWETGEEPAGPALTFLRDKRDGVLGLLDDALDLQLAVFAEGALLTASALMLVSDAVGLVDDNPVTQHVTCAVASKALAKTAYLLHVSGSEAILGSHGLEADWYLEASLVQVNPLLEPEQAEPALPLDPLDFVGEAYLHTRPQTVRVPGAIAATAVVADAVIRPLGHLALFFDLHGPAQGLESAGTGLVRRAVP